MSMRVLLGVALGVLLFIGVGSAGVINLPGASLTAVPSYLQVSPGGTNSTSIVYNTPINTTSLGVNTLTYSVVGSSYFTASAGPVYYYDNVTGTYELVSSNVTSYGLNGTINWTGPPGMYIINMTVSAASSTPLSTSCNISLTASSFNASFTTGNIYYNVTTTTLPVYPVSELLTAILVGAGLVSVALWRRWI